jgi:hypothetical protein
LGYTDKFDELNVPGQIEVTVTLKEVSVGTDLNIVQEGVPDGSRPIRSSKTTCRRGGPYVLFEVGIWPPHDGFRRIRWFNLSGALADDGRQGLPPVRTHATLVPVRTSSCRSRTG